MRIVSRADDLAAALEAARGEARRAFGNGSVFLERYLEEARHVEIQIVADTHGGIVSLFERECSIQRRHQKIVEEAPSPVVDDDLRERMASSAVAAARAVGYVNAGTVEFLVDARGNHYFLEMNPRLQVEHPVTELVCGIDLVGLQLEVAAGRPLPGGDVVRRGHAIEARIYAEDPAHDFTPSTGRLHRVRWPTGPGVRIDAGVETGDEVSHRYDPLLAKLVVHAPDRPAAMARMRRALDETVVLGVSTNLDLLRSVLAHPTFLDGRATTAFVENDLAFGTSESPVLTDDVIVAMALAESFAPAAGGASRPRVGGEEAWTPWERADGFRMGR
jgi:acetyl/propionyl-CoA carboxylase alpha subunit